MSTLLFGAIIGTVATACMDIWAIFLKITIKNPLPNWSNVGRWVGHLGRGRLFHDSIANAAPINGELTIGWVFHYVVGIVYGIAFSYLMGQNWIELPTFLPAWIFAILTIGAGWFLLHPGMGLGWALSKTPNPTRGRVFGLMAHTVFGLGLYLTALVL